MSNNNHKYTYSKCKFCGKKKSWITDSFMVPDGYDDVDWDFNEYCLNKQCPSNKLLFKNKNMSKTNKYPTIEATNYDIKTKSLEASVEFCDCGIFIDIRREDDESYHVYLQSSEELNDLAEIIKKINSLNLGE